MRMIIFLLALIPIHIPLNASADNNMPPNNNPKKSFQTLNHQHYQLIQHHSHHLTARPSLSLMT